MPRPGTDIEILEQRRARGANLDTGQMFALGTAERGSVTDAIECKSLGEYERACGGFLGGPVLHNSVRGYFMEQGSTAWIARLEGGGAKAATEKVATLTATAASPGAWGNAVSVAVEAETGLLADAIAHLNGNGESGGRAARPAARRRRPRAPDEPAPADQPTQEMATLADEENGEGEGATPAPRVSMRVVVRVSGQRVASSPRITTIAEAVAWHNDYVTLAGDPEDDLEPSAAITLKGGTSDAKLTNDDIKAALARFDYAKGPGQVTYPGEDDPAIHELIMAHAHEMRRCPLLDEQDTGDETILAADTVALYGKKGVRMSAALAPPLIYPGPANVSINVQVPYSAIQAGIIARQDRLTGNPNAPAAGVNGYSLHALGLAHDWPDDVREQLNEIGVTLAKVRYGEIRTYGSRTAAGPDDPDWKWFGGSRVVMAIAHEGDAAAEYYVHRQIDARGHTFVELEKDLLTICMKYYDVGALYGETPAEAFVIDAFGPNTPETINNGEIHADIALKCAPPGEWVHIGIARVPLDTVLAAAA